MARNVAMVGHLKSIQEVRRKDRSAALQEGEGRLIPRVEAETAHSGKRGEMLLQSRTRGHQGTTDHQEVPLILALLLLVLYIY